MLKEEFLQQLLAALYDQEELNVYDYATSCFSTQSNEFSSTKTWCDQLVRDKLAIYADPVHSLLNITNFGKFWMTKGGYQSFLETAHCTKDHPREKPDLIAKPHQKEKEQLLEARLKLIHYRLTGFWLTLVISSLGFFLSLYNLYLIMQGRK